MKKLNIWLIKEGEALPIAQNARLMRMGALAKYLAEHGHKVTWWTSTFIHGQKEYIYYGCKEIDVSENERLILLHSPIAYKKNISARRILYHKLLAVNFLRISPNCKKPDIILCAWPTPQFAKAALKYGKRRKIPVVIDIRDLWPDIFERVFPEKFRFLGKIMLCPLKYSTGKIMSAAAGIVGKEDRSLQWGCDYAGRRERETDKRIFIGGSYPVIDRKELDESLIWWRGQNVLKENWNICFFSTLSEKSLDLETVIRAVNVLREKYPLIHLIIGGKGDGENYYRSLAADMPNIHFAGWLNQEQMNSLMAISKCGVYCLRNTEDFKDTFTNKAVQYLSGGLPLINSLTGFARGFIETNHIGMNYEEGNIRNCAEVIETMYRDEKSRKLMSEMALDVFGNYFEENVVNSQFENYLCMMVKEY